jgi:hypothetical protein
MNARRAAILLTFASSLLLALAIALPTVAQYPAGAPVKLGKVSFPVSCNPAAQKEFEVAMAFYHSFAWPENKAALDRVSQADPACGMAHWGRALGMLDNPFLAGQPLAEDPRRRAGGHRRGPGGRPQDPA